MDIIKGLEYTVEIKHPRVGTSMFVDLQYNHFIQGNPTYAVYLRGVKYTVKAPNLDALVFAFCSMLNPELAERPFEFCEEQEVKLV
jgi:hypothetical protein